ncbi:radical SAM family protein [Vibrio owensii]
MSRFKPYKYYAGLTSQIGFCATPLRLDSYNNCQFSCAYCFAATRQGHGRKNIFQISNPESLRSRINGVNNGIVKSALDEFIQRRIPFQLGGMSDPFILSEKKHRVTLKYLKILKDYNYPVIISTKSDLIGEKEYIDVLRESNCYVRFSTTVIREELRHKIDRKCPSISKIFKVSEKLAEKNIPTSFRLQPIIPGEEKFSSKLIDSAIDCGVSHISSEYLKVPLDANINFGKELKEHLNGNPIKLYTDLGAIRMGREYQLPLSYRREHLLDICKKSRRNGLTFGFADNDLLLHSDGISCCNASDLYLKDAGFFNGNITSLANSKSENDNIYFSDYLECWIPKHKVSTYLNSKARLIVPTSEPDWLGYLKEMWAGKLGIYKPDFFDGIVKTDQFDSNGLSVYQKVSTEFSRSMVDQ